MSSIIIRQVVGQGDFAVPTTQAQAENSSAALQALLDTISWFYYDDARIMVINPNNDVTPELAFVINTYFYQGSMIPTTNSVRAALNTALLGNQDIISIGDINIDDAVAGDIFYDQWPDIDWIDGANGIVQYRDNVPAGAQILLCKYTRWKKGLHYSQGVPVSPHIGKRYHAFMMLGVGELQINLLPWVFNNRYRNNFRARYFWPDPPGSTAPAEGILGPMAPYGVSTANRWEISLGLNIMMEPAPSTFGN